MNHEHMHEQTERIPPKSYWHPFSEQSVRTNNHIELHYVWSMDEILCLQKPIK